MFMSLILSVCVGAVCAAVVANMHGGWIGGKCRLATSTIARGLGDAWTRRRHGRIDAGYDTHRQSVFLRMQRGGLTAATSNQPTGETDACPRLSRKGPQPGRTDSLQLHRIGVPHRGRRRVLALRADQGERLLDPRGDVLSVSRGVQSAAAAAGSGGLSQHHRRARLPDPAVLRTCLAIVGAWACSA